MDICIYVWVSYTMCVIDTMCVWRTHVCVVGWLDKARSRAMDDVCVSKNARIII
jgi:hypothetical protein